MSKPPDAGIPKPSPKTEFADLDQFPDGHITVGDYTRTLGCVHDLMPYEHLSCGPWDALAELKAWLQSQPKTMATFQFRDLPDDTKAEWTKIGRKNTLMHILGGWISHHANQSPRWVNPYYVHLDELDWTPMEDKLDHYKTMAQYGKFSSTDLGKRYNVTRYSVGHLLTRHGYDFEELRLEGRRRMANTVRVSAEWTDRTALELADLLDIKRTNMLSWLQRYADVDVPPRPCTHDRASVWGWPGSQ